MAIPHASKLIEQAKAGVKLTTKERKHCMAFFMATECPTNADLAALFQVTPRMVRFYKLAVRKAAAEEIQQEDLGLVIADINIALEKTIRDLEKSRKETELGSRGYLDHTTSIAKMHLKRIEALQALGFYPKNLGNMTVEKFQWQADVGKDGAVSTRPVDMEFTDIEEADNNIMDAEFEMAQPPMLEAKKETMEDAS